MIVQKNIPLAPYTSFGVGGRAEFFAETHSTEELLELIQNQTYEKVWLLGYGSNSLISDNGLAGLVICMRGGKIQIKGTQAIVDAGVWWDDVVSRSIEAGLWGIELMSEIPGSVGGALFINITAYGQSIGSRICWIEIWDRKTSTIKRLNKEDLSWGYKSSIFQLEEYKDVIILRACLELSKTPIESLEYQKALDVALELGLDTNSLDHRREIIIETRKRAGSLWQPKNIKSERTVGSFFRNPFVTPEQAKKVIAFDESGKTASEIEKMNQIHGGDTLRVSAAHVMLAAGFHRGQTWNHVKLNDHNLLKIEALPGATAQDIYNVATLIQQKCHELLGIELEPEARILGDFTTDGQRSS